MNLLKSMDVIRIFNGLGNQMSQYAFYYAKKRCHPYLTFFVTNRYESENIHNGYELGRIFGIKSNALKERILYHVLESLFKPVFGYRILGKFTKQIQEVSNYDFNKNLLESSLNLRFTFYWGGWHSPKYFEKYRNELLNVFKFKEELLNDETKLWLYRINKDIASCSLHIRRGDFLKDKKWSDAITPDYYDNAIKYIKQHIQDPHFYVFSNDVEWCRKIFGENGFDYINCNSGIDSWQDMFLMTKCRNHINANSSFSWWGAWLCPYDNAITICPKAFISTSETKDVYPDEWIKL